MAAEIDGLDYERFVNDLTSGTARKAFEADLKTSKRWQAFGFPTMLFYKAGANLDKLDQEDAIYVNGHRTLETYDRVLGMLDPTLEKHAPRPVEELIREYGPMTSKEIALSLNQTIDQVEKTLSEMPLKSTELVRGRIWAMD